jgi:predicted PurR-regulated permease PerM
MVAQGNEQRGVRFLVIMAALVIIIWGIYQAQSVVVALLVSVFLATIGTPAVMWLRRKRIPQVAAVLIVVAGMVAVLLVIGVLVGASINSFSSALPSLQARLEQQVTPLKDLLARSGIGMPDKFLLTQVNPGSVMGLVAGIFAGLSSVLSNIVLILLTVTFILIEASSFPNKLSAALGKPQASFTRFDRFVDDIKHYMVIKTAISLINGVLIWLWLTILGVDFSALWGLLAFLLHYVPNIGSVIAAIPAVLLTLIQFGPVRAALVAAGYIIVEFTLGNIVEPRIMGRGLGLSTLVVFLSLVFWGSLLGLFGMILSVPITMTMKLAFESNEGTRWIAVLLGPEPLPRDV